MYPARGPSRYAAGRSISKQPDPAGNHLPLASESAGKASSRDCHAWRAESPNGQGGRVAEGELRETLARGGTRDHGADRRIDVTPPIPLSHCDEPASIPEAASLACSQRAHAE